MPLQPNGNTEWSTGIDQSQDHHIAVQTPGKLYFTYFIESAQVAVQWCCPMWWSSFQSLFRLQIWWILSLVSSYFAWRTNSSEIRGAGTRRIIMQCLPWELILCFSVCCVCNKRAFRTKEREWEPAWARCFPLKPWVTFIVERRLGGGGQEKEER